MKTKHVLLLVLAILLGAVVMWHAHSYFSVLRDPGYAIGVKKGVFETSALNIDSRKFTYRVEKKRKGYAFEKPRTMLGGADLLALGYRE